MSKFRLRRSAPQGSRKGDIVNANGVSWVCIRDTRDSDPTDSADWQPAVVDDPTWIGEPGPKGDKGDSIAGPPGRDSTVPGPPGTDGRSFRLRGEWSRRTDFQPLDVVTHENNTYVARESNRGREPSDTSRYWQLLAKSIRGPAGADGLIYRAGSRRVAELIGKVEQLEQQVTTANVPLAAIFDSAAVKGMALYVPSDGHIDVASNDNADKATVIGLCFADVSANAAGQFLTEGQIARDDWTPVADTFTLTPGVVYYLGVNGQLSVYAPTTDGRYVVAVGRAVDRHTLDLEIAEPILL